MYHQQDSANVSAETDIASPSVSITAPASPSILVSNEQAFLFCFPQNLTPDIDKGITIFDSHCLLFSEEFILHALYLLFISFMQTQEADQAKISGLIEKLLCIDAINWQRVLDDKFYKNTYEKQIANYEDVNLILDAQFSSLFQVAVMANSPSHVAALLDKDAPISHKTADDKPEDNLLLAMYTENPNEATKKNTIDIIKLILEKNQQITNKAHRIKHDTILAAIQAAINKAQPDYVAAIIEHGGNIDTKPLLIDLLITMPLALEQCTRYYCQAQAKHPSRLQQIATDDLSIQYDNVISCYKTLIANATHTKLLKTLRTAITNIIEELADVERIAITAFQNSDEEETLTRLITNRSLRKTLSDLFRELQCDIKTRIEALDPKEIDQFLAELDREAASSKQTASKKKGKTANNKPANTFFSKPKGSLQTVTEKDEDEEIELVEADLLKFARVKPQKPKTIATEKVKQAKQTTPTPIKPTRPTPSSPAQANRAKSKSTPTPINRQRVQKKEKPLIVPNPNKHPDDFAYREADFPLPVVAAVTSQQTQAPVTNSDAITTTSTSDISIVLPTASPAPSLSIAEQYDTEDDSFSNLPERESANSTPSSIPSSTPSSMATTTSVLQRSSSRFFQTPPQASQTPFPTAIYNPLWIAPRGGVVVETLEARVVLVPALRLRAMENVQPHERIVGSNIYGGYEEPVATATLSGGL